MLRILLVDDAKEDVLLTQRVIQGCKILNPISVFHSGIDLFTHLQNRRPLDGERPERAIILLDLIMVPTSGLDVLRYWQSSPWAHDSFVIMVSGLKDIKAINEGYQLGAKTFLLKPVIQSDFLHVLRSFPNHFRMNKVGEGYAIEWVEQQHPFSNPSRSVNGVRFPA